MSKVVQKNNKKKSHYFKHKIGKNPYYTISINLRGFLVTCNDFEKLCIQESYNILNKYADILYPSPDNEGTSTNNEEMEDELKTELNQLRIQPNTAKRFQAIDSGAKNILFIRTPLENPLELVSAIVEDIHTTKVQQTKFLLRLIPIETTCKAYLPDIEKCIEPLLQKYFSNEPKTFSIYYKCRNNNTITRDEVITLVANMVGKTRDGHKVDLNNAQLTVVIEIIRSFAFIGFVPEFFKYRKYNLISLCKAPFKNTDDEKGGEMYLD